MPGQAEQKEKNNKALFTQVVLKSRWVSQYAPNMGPGKKIQPSTQAKHSLEVCNFLNPDRAQKSGIKIKNTSIYSVFKESIQSSQGC